MADVLGDDCDLVVGFCPDAGAMPLQPLLRQRVSELQAAAESRRRPPGLLDLALDIGAQPCHGVLHVQVGKVAAVGVCVVGGQREQQQGLIDLALDIGVQLCHDMLHVQVG